MFDLAIDSKLRGCDLVTIKIGDVVAGADIRHRAIVIQQKANRPVQFDLTGDVRTTLSTWKMRCFWRSIRKFESRKRSAACVGRPLSGRSNSRLQTSRQLVLTSFDPSAALSCHTPSLDLVCQLRFLSPSLS